MALQPLRRDPALVPLSHDHHEGLIAAVRLKSGRSAYKDIEDPLQSIGILWQDDLRAHFEQEERILFSRKWSAGVETMVAQALDEHGRIRLLVESVEAGNGNEALLQEFGALLEQHIRFEERQLFGAMQEELSDEDLAAVGSALAGMREPKSCRTRGAV